MVELVDTRLHAPPPPSSARTCKNRTAASSTSVMWGSGRLVRSIRASSSVPRCSRRAMCSSAASPPSLSSPVTAVSPSSRPPAPNSALPPSPSGPPSCPCTPPASTWDPRASPSPSPELPCARTSLAPASWLGVPVPGAPPQTRPWLLRPCELPSAMPQVSQRKPPDRPGVFPVDPDRRSPRRMRPKETSGVVARFVSSSRRNNEGHGLTAFPYNSVCANGSPVSTPASNV
jgi:hypothetical protein